MKANRSGGLTTVTKSGANIAVTTNNWVDYRRMRRRGFTTASNPAGSPAVFNVALGNHALYLRLLKVFEPPEQQALEGLGMKYRQLMDARPPLIDSLAVTRTP